MQAGALHGRAGSLHGGADALHVRAGALHGRAGEDLREGTQVEGCLSISTMSDDIGLPARGACGDTRFPSRSHWQRPCLPLELW